MKDAELKHFVESVLAYFTSGTKIAATVAVPYMKDPKKDELSEYTGIIGFTGKRRGGIYVTCTTDFLKDLVKAILNMTAPAPDILKDMAGELANTIAGNVTEAFGNEFEISVPVVIEGMPKSINLPTAIPTYVIPINWQQHKIFLHVGMSS